VIDHQRSVNGAEEVEVRITRYPSAVVDAVNETATKINESYDDGKTNSGFLTCPTTGGR
jgi:hypothetical protein